jgi:hypothetical protein
MFISPPLPPHIHYSDFISFVFGYLIIASKVASGVARVSPWRRYLKKGPQLQFYALFQVMGVNIYPPYTHLGYATGSGVLFRLFIWEKGKPK